MSALVPQHFTKGQYALHSLGVSFLVTVFLDRTSAQRRAGPKTASSQCLTWSLNSKSELHARETIMSSLESAVRARTRDCFAPLIRELRGDAAKKLSRPGMSWNECPQETGTAQRAGAWSAPAGKLAAMSGCSPIVFLLDDEPSVVMALGRILRANGFSTRGWTSATTFLNAHDAQTPGCLVTDLRMPGVTGLEVQRVMLARGIDRPVIFITDERDIQTTVLGMRAGAVTVLAKPVQPPELIEAVREAIMKDTTMRARRCEQADISARLARLTARERQVLPLMSAGMLNKQIAEKLGSAEKTIKIHRGRLLCKMQVRTATALVSLLSRADLLEAAGSAVSQRGRPQRVVNSDGDPPNTVGSHVACDPSSAASVVKLSVPYI